MRRVRGCANEDVCAALQGFWSAESVDARRSCPLSEPWARCGRTRPASGRRGVQQGERAPEVVGHGGSSTASASLMSDRSCQVASNRPRESARGGQPGSPLAEAEMPASVRSISCQSSRAASSESDYGARGSGRAMRSSCPIRRRAMPTSTSASSRSGTTPAARSQGSELNCGSFTACVSVDSLGRSALEPPPCPCLPAQPWRRPA